ncbi:hypothetical protein SteCoe_4334 [Stentor coeruleus]|uniref:RING-CH-type domain-containing protein n=1 Tax=Stentor coeruleus TaxID=5963 RepID=A0A1R2CUY6_9CILI|nr:hypothetical protein SteCoe_4334 [Stentor coeruleus]
MQSIDLSNSYLDPIESPIKRLTHISLEVRRSSISSPLKVQTSKSGEIFIENCGFLKQNYAFELDQKEKINVAQINIEKETTFCPDEQKMCRICYSSENGLALVSSCSCTGSQKYVHEECLKTWLLNKKQENLGQCELCKTDFRMKFEVISIWMPFKDIKTCKSWAPCLISVLLLAAITYICYISFENKSNSLVTTTGSVILGFICIACCAKSFFSMFRVCFVRKIQNWKIIDNDNP